MATEEDKENLLDYWARLFTATSWEELKMIAEKNPSMSEATQTLYELNSDMMTQEMCFAREEYYRRQRTMNRNLELLQNEIDEKNEELAEKNEELAEKNEELAEKDEQLNALKARILELEKQLKTKK